MRRVVLVLTDGLRPDAISPGLMPSLDALAREHTQALEARTVRPSSTVAALTSLATGLSPAAHGMIEPGLRFLQRLKDMRPVARELARAGLPSRIVASSLPAVERSIVWALATAAGIPHIICAGREAREVARAALDAAQDHPAGVLFVYLNDCDQAGHAHGWMSLPYRRAASEVDAAVGALSALAADSLFIVLADHGGGGVTATDHREPHEINDRIPLVLAGPGVTRRHQLTRRVSLLDVPPTLLYWLGVDIPESYEGRALTEALTARRPVEATA